MTIHRAWIAPLLMLWTSTLTLSLHAQSSFKIGEINSYKAQPAFLEP